MRKRQKSKKRKGYASRQFDHRDQDWLTNSECFSNVNESGARRHGSDSSDRRTKRRGKCDSVIRQIDVNLQEYADNPQAPLTNRVSKAKGVKIVLHKEAEMESTVKKEDDVVDDWFLQDEWDLDLQEPQEGEDSQDELGDDEGDIAEATSDPEETSSNHEGIEYPSDIWYIISNYISPLQVGCFASICKDAYIVTTTAAFWKKLYQRFYNAEAKLPLELQPFSMLRTYGIRTLAIRALHLMFEPYVAHTKSIPPIGDGMDSPDTLINKTCLYMWSRGQVGCHYYHYFKFRDVERGPGITNCVNGDVFFNPHRNDCILKVFCQNFQHFPSHKVMGLRLVNISVSVSANFRYHRLKLQFTNKQCKQKERYRETDLVSVVLDPVILVRVLHWWHPQFQECLNQSTTYGTASTVSNASAVWEGRI